jgi:3D (Asp-Asp-Asp) domain-containing protein
MTGRRPLLLLVVCFWMGGWVSRSAGPAPEEGSLVPPPCEASLQPLPCGIQPEEEASQEEVGLPKLGDFLVTFYWIADESEERFRAQPRDTPLLDGNDNPIAFVCRQYLKTLNMQGTGRLADGRMVNYHDCVDGNIRYAVVDAPYGIGAMGVPLIPFRSVAVDRRRIPLGSLLYIPAARGILLPGGEVHDGVFFATDVGSAITGYHLDFFLGEAHLRPIFERSTIRSGGRVEVFAVPGS